MSVHHLREKPLRCPEDREDVISTETWNGGAGTITFNYLQQRETDVSENDDQAASTDPWSISD
jgi:hypothetical protein